MNELVEGEIRHAIAQGGPTSHLLRELRADLAAAQARLAEMTQERDEAQKGLSWTLEQAGTLAERIAGDFKTRIDRLEQAETTLAAIRAACEDQWPTGYPMSDYAVGFRDAQLKVLALLDAAPDAKETR